MWARNVLCVGLCLVAFSALAAGLLRLDHIQDPETYRPQAHQNDADFQRTLSTLNQQLQESWQAEGIEPTPQADNLTIARRMALGLMGTVPSLEEVRALEKIPPAEQLNWYASRVFEDRRYADHVGERLARAYVGVEPGPFLVYRRRRFVAWLSDRLHEDARYDSLVRQLIADTGLWTSSPAVNFVTVTLDQNDDKGPDEMKLAARTSRAFLGMRIDCLQCHDDNLGTMELGESDDPASGLQTHFHELAAFFAEADSSLMGIQDDRKQKYKYTYLNEEEETLVQPAVPFAPHLLGESGNKRQQLARWVTHKENFAFARATVNRFWGILFGRPMIQPIDDIPLHGELPPGMQVLTDDFVAHGYDVRRLLRLMVMSDAFQRDSRAEFDITELHESRWASFPLIRLRPEQVSGSIMQACSLRTIDSGAHIITKLQSAGQQNDFIKRYGDMGEDEFEDRGGTITQRLLMMNGNVVKERTERNLVMNASTRIATLTEDEKKAIEAAYLATLTRRPTQAEEEHFLKQMKEAKGRNRIRSLEDLYWVLLNSTEFSWNH